MRISEILGFDSDARKSDVLMQTISNAFTRRGEVKGLSAFGHTGDQPYYGGSVGLPQPDDDPAAHLPATSLTSEFPGEDQVATPPTDLGIEAPPIPSQHSPRTGNPAALRRYR